MTPSARPAIALQVGLIGHRDLSGADRKALGAAASQLLREIANAVADAHRADQTSASPAYLEQPPKLRCICGLAAGADALLSRIAIDDGWSLIAALAFSRAEFERDFNSNPERDEFHRLLTEAGAVCELDGDRASGPLPYVEVGEYIVEHSDLILAIWDGQPAQGPGGTGDVVRRAMERGKPVAVLPPHHPHSVEWRDPDFRDVAHTVEAILAALSEGAFPKAYFDEARDDAGWAVQAMRAYERLASLHIGWTEQTSVVPPAEPDFAAPALEIDDELARHFDRADRFAIAYAARYRVAGLMRYGLILPATLGSLIASLSERPYQIGGNLAQFVILIFLLLFSSKYWQQPIHHRFVAYRALAEQLRTERLLAPLSGLATRHGGDWTTWLTRSLVRAVGPRSALFDPASTAAAADFIRSQTKEQIAFLTARATRYETIAGRLSRAGIWLSALGVIFAALRAISAMTQIEVGAMPWLNQAALLAPAMGAVFLGLLSFHEYRRISARYRAIATELQAALRALDAAPPIRARVLAIARGIAQIMLAEGADWRMLIISRTISAF